MSNYHKEVAWSRRAADIGISPYIEHVYTVKCVRDDRIPLIDCNPGYCVIKMIHAGTPLHTHRTLSDAQKANIIAKCINRISKHLGVIHADLHEGNILYDNASQVFHVIDWGKVIAPQIPAFSLDQTIIWYQLAMLSSLPYLRTYFQLFIQAGLRELYRTWPPKGTKIVLEKHSILDASHLVQMTCYVYNMSFRRDDGEDEQSQQIMNKNT